MTPTRSDRPCCRMGLIGLPIVLILNLVGLYFFHRHAAEFFTEPWWSTWFPSYGVWLAFALTGLSGRLRK